MEDFLEAIAKPAVAKRMSKVFAEAAAKDAEKAEAKEAKEAERKASKEAKREARDMERKLAKAAKALTEAGIDPTTLGLIEAA